MSFLCLLAGWLLIASPSPNPSPNPTSPSPRINVEPAVFNFGNVVPNGTLEKEFAIRNSGNADLVLGQISTTCGCTVAQPDSKIVKPGRSVPLRVTFRPGSAAGRVERRVLVRSNDPVHSILEIKVEATVKASAQ